MISIINCYALTSAAEEEEKEEFYSDLESTITEEKSYYKYICGDLNGTVGNGRDGNRRIGNHGNEEKNENGFRVLDIIFSCNLYHGNSLFKKKFSQLFL